MIVLYISHTYFSCVKMYLMPIWSPLLSFLISASIGRHLGSSGVYINSILSIILSSFSSIYIFYEVCICQSICKIDLCTWIHIEFLNIKWGFLYDSLSAVMLIVINIVSLCAQLYSIEYMRDDPHNIRFFSYLSLFTFFMIFLVLSDNLLQLFMGWEGVGICSYLLINFWATRLQANKASILAVITNKFGDISLLVCCAIVYSEWKTLNFSALFSCIQRHTMHDMLYSIQLDRSYYGAYYEYRYFTPLITSNSLIFEDVDILRQYDVTLLCFFIVLAAVGKSAQAGLHIWLPEAMEGPTPVSSLIHAATMVTAGIFLLVRCSYFFSDLNSSFVYIIFLGSITSFFSSTIGLLQSDLKKVVAYSTCSQLGYMFVCCGFSAYGNSMFHLFNHAFFKALLFLTAGYIIHAMSNEQDIRKMGGILNLLPLPYMMMLIGSLSLIGFPFLSGFYSKDKIIELCFNYYISSYDFIPLYKYVILCQSLCIFAVIFTLIYSIKLILYIFLNSYNGFRNYVSNIHFSSLFTQMPLLFLSVLSIISGYLTSDMMVGVGSPFWLKSIRIDTFFLSENNIYKSFFLLHTEYNHYIRQITLFWTFYFLSTSIYILTSCKYFFYYSITGTLSWFRNLFVTINKKYLFINRLLVIKLLNKSFYFSYNVAYKMFDKGLIEFIGPFGVISAIRNILVSQYKMQSGLIYHYSGFLFLMLIFLLHLFFDYLYYYL